MAVYIDRLRVGIPIPASRKVYTAWYCRECVPKERNDAGRYVETASLGDVMEVFDAVDGPPVVTSADVAEGTGLSRDSARRKLERLRDRGNVARRRSAGRVLHWPAEWDHPAPAAEEDAERPAHGDGDEFDADDLQGDPSTTLDDTDAESGQERGESASLTPADPADGSDADPTSTADTAGERRSLADVVDAVAAAEGWVENDTDDRLAARKAAARAVLDYAAEHGAVSKTDAVEHVRPEHPVEGQDARTWYRKTIRPVLNEAAEYDQSARAYQLVADVEA